MASNRPRLMSSSLASQEFEGVVKSLIPDPTSSLEYESDEHYELVPCMTSCFVIVRVRKNSSELELLRRVDYFAERGIQIHPAVIADFMLEMSMASELVDLMRTQPLARVHVRRVAVALEAEPFARFASYELRSIVPQMLSVADCMDARDSAAEALEELLDMPCASYV